MNSLPNIRERVGYIDAMRGFMMLLVVYSHILYFGYGSLFLEHRTSFNDVFTIIYMPLFFFISGFVSKYKLINLLPYLINKFKTLIIPTVFFLIIYLLLFNCTFIPIIMSESKGGYWFTITLFEFFVIYAIGNFFSQKLTVNERWQDFFLVIGALITYAVSAPSFSVRLLGLDYDIVTALGITQWRFYIFFMVGVLFHKHSVWFEKLLDNSWVIGFVIVSFFLIVLYYCQDGYKPIGAIYHLFFIFLGVSGINSCFRFFSQISKYIYKYTHRERLSIYRDTDSGYLFVTLFFSTPASSSFRRLFF